MVTGPFNACWRKPASAQEQALAIAAAIAAMRARLG